MSFDLSVIPHKNIILAVTGGIAAYKSAIIVRRLKDYGFNVRVVMTHGAQAFITPLTFQALSGNPVHTELLDPEAEAGMGHIRVGALGRLGFGCASKLRYFGKICARFSRRFTQYLVFGD